MLFFNIIFCLPSNLAMSCSVKIGHCSQFWSQTSEGKGISLEIRRRGGKLAARMLCLPCGGGFSTVKIDVFLWGKGDSGAGCFHQKFQWHSKSPSSLSLAVLRAALPVSLWVCLHRILLWGVCPAQDSPLRNVPSLQELHSPRVGDHVQEEKNVLLWSQDRGNGMCLFCSVCVWF